MNSLYTYHHCAGGCGINWMHATWLDNGWFEKHGRICGECLVVERQGQLLFK